MWQAKKVSVVLPTYREKNSIRKVIGEFERSGYVDEIIVVDNNAEPGTRQEVSKTRANLISENHQGYAYAIRTGIKRTTGDLIIIAEPDGTFDGRDVVKLLAYSDDFDMVFGSRTHAPLIREGSDMTPAKHILDILLAKMATWLFFCPLLTDLGCTLRLTHKSAWRRISKDLSSDEGIFSIKWILIAVTRRINYIQIPVNFRARVGPSTQIGSFIQKADWGVREFFFIWSMWFTYQTRRIFVK